MNKIDKINELKAEQKAYIKKAQRIAKLPEAKKTTTAIGRAFKVVYCFLAIYKIKKQIIALMTHQTNQEMNILQKNQQF